MEIRSQWDYFMACVTFGVSASSFTAMPLTTGMIIPRWCRSLFMLTIGATGSKSALILQRQAVLTWWNSNDPSVLKKRPVEHRDSREIQTLPEDTQYSWNVSANQYCLSVTKPPSSDQVTKRSLVSDVSMLFDALGLFAPIIINMKIIFRPLWELKIDWDDPAPDDVLEVW